MSGSSFKNAKAATSVFAAANTDYTIYTCPATGILSTVMHGIFIANMTSNSITITVKVGGITLLNGANIPAGGTEEFDKPVNLVPNDTFTVATNTVSGVNVFCSVMENS